MPYFDYAATTPLSPGAEKAMIDALKTQWHNPSGQYALGFAVGKCIQAHRQTLANALGCTPDSVVFTSGGTESNNWAIFQGAKRGRGVSGKGKHLITSKIEHSSVLSAVQSLEQQGYAVTTLSPNAQGHITKAQVLEALQEDTALVSLMMVNNETGVRTAVEDIATALKQQSPKTLVHCDGVQAFGKLQISLEKTDMDLFSVSGHKIFAPKGIGALYVKQGLSLPPYLVGGGQEGGKRSGTEATHQIASFACAVQESQEKFGENQEKLRETRVFLENSLKQIQGVKLPDLGDTAPHILPFSLVSYPSEVVLRFLGEREVYLSAGSACHRGKKSKVYDVLPLSPLEKMGMLRASISPLTTKTDIHALCQGLVQARDGLISMK